MEEQDTKEKYTDKWGWVRCIDRVAKETNRSWNDVYELNVLEYLNTLSYINDETNRRNSEIKNKIL